MCGILVYIGDIIYLEAYRKFTFVSYIEKRYFFSLPYYTTYGWNEAHLMKRMPWYRPNLANTAVNNLYTLPHDRIRQSFNRIGNAPWDLNSLILYFYLFTPYGEGSSSNIHINEFTSSLWKFLTATLCWEWKMSIFIVSKHICVLFGEAILAGLLWEF